MNINLIAYLYIKNHYENIRKCCCNCILKEKCEYSQDNIQKQSTTFEKNVINNEPQSAPALQSFEKVTKSTEPDKENINENDLNVNAVVNAALSDDNEHIIKENIEMRPENIQQNNVIDTKIGNQDNCCGLLHYRKWWERTEVEILVNGKLITGIPIFIEENTLRVINDDYSYFIPLEKVDYIRTKDGLRSSFDAIENISQKVDKSLR